jgi:hypothetical protein
MRANPRDTTEPRHLIALWLHESARVFEDRLTTDDDRRWFRGQQERLLGGHFGTTWEEVVGEERLIYGDFLVPGAEPKVWGAGLLKRGPVATRARMDVDGLNCVGRGVLVMPQTLCTLLS